MPVRFQYRQVEPNDFGLTVEEVRLYFNRSEFKEQKLFYFKILSADDRDLNAWCSLKKTSQYRSKDEELRDYHTYRNKAKNLEKKQKILASVYQPKNDDDERYVEISFRKIFNLKNFISLNERINFVYYDHFLFILYNLRT